MKLLAARGKKAAATVLTLSLLSQQGLFVSPAFAQVVSAPVRTGTPAVPVVPAAPGAFGSSAAAPAGAPAALPALSAPLSLPVPVLPFAAAPRAAVAAGAASLAVPAAPAPAAASPADPSVPAAQAALAAPAALPAAQVAASAPLETAAEAAAVRGRPAAAGLGRLGAALTRGRTLASSALARVFDGKAASAVSPEGEPARADAPRRALPAAAARLAPSDEAPRPAPESAEVPAPSARRAFIEFNAQYLRDIKKHFSESMTKPNKQDYMFLLTKTFGLNLAIRVAFAVKGVQAGDLPFLRAILSTAWYQLQDGFFTVFGQTYMKFLGRMTGMLRIGNAKLGDLLFVYVQLVASEFLNRLVLGPIGENPLVYTWGGMGLLLLNNLQGMISGGLLVPVINKLRAAGLISERTSNWLYQAASLTMHLGLLATFGYQSLFTVLTTALMVLSWGAYIGLSFFAKAKPSQEPKP